MSGRSSAAISAASSTIGPHEVDGEHVGAREQFVLADERRAGGLGALGGEILAPGQDLHAEGAPDRRHARPELATHEDRERLAVQRRADGLLPAALAHALVLLRY